MAKGLQGKVPKGVAACVDVLLQALKAFGVRVVKPSPLMKAVSTLLDHKDGAVRVGAKDIAARQPAYVCDCDTPSSHSAETSQVELTRWLGPAAVKRDLTSKMRDAQKKEVWQPPSRCGALSGSVSALHACIGIAPCRWRKRSRL